MDCPAPPPAPPSAPCPLKEKGVGTNRTPAAARDRCEPPGTGWGRGRTDVRAGLRSAPGLQAEATQREGSNLALGLAGPPRAPAPIGWRGFRGSPALQLKPPGCARLSRELPAGRANLAIQPPLSPLSPLSLPRALAPLSEKPRAVSPRPRKDGKGG
jgi:hypothetical protein